MIMITELRFDCFSTTVHSKEKLSTVSTVEVLQLINLDLGNLVTELL